MTNVSTRPETVFPGPVLLSVHDAAERLSLCEKTVRQLLASGELRACRIGRAIRVSTSAIESFIRAKESGVAHE